MNDCIENISITKKNDGNALVLSISGTLTHKQVKQLITQLSSLNNESTVSHIHIHADSVTNYDSAGLVALHSITRKFKVTFHAASDGMQRLWDTVTQDNEAPTEPLSPPLTRVQKIGKACCDQYEKLGKAMIYFGEMLYYVYYWASHPRAIRLRKFWYYVENIGPGSLLLTLLIGTLFGLILSFQSIVQLKKFGAEIYVANLVSVSLIRELGPLLMAIILTGRIASAYAAEISAMKVNQEIDALKAMGLDPIPFLVIPRLIAGAIVAPFVTLILDAAALFGCGLLMVKEGFGVNVVIKQMFDFVQISDIFSSMFKSSIFGLLVVGIGCVHGLKSGRNATAVGQATTTTVVQCIVMITVVDGIFTTVFYSLGI
jgi:phospholipid/cholesterol/gamma-HCH transport system permease protein